MARSDAIGKEPTIDEINAGEAATFQGFTTTDGVVSKGEQTAEEAAAHAAQAALKGAKAPPAAKLTGGKVAGSEGEETEEEETDDSASNETPEAKAAREAAEAKLTPAQKAAKAIQAKVGGKDAKHRSANDRIGQAVAKQRATERELATEREERARERGAFEARLAALEKRPLTADGKSATVIDKDAPRAVDYEYGELDAGYIRDLAVYETRKVIAEDRKADTATRQTAEQRREAQEFTTKAKAFEVAGLEKFDDFAEVVVDGAKNNDWPLTKTFGDLMFDSPVGPDIAYYLATHPDKAKEIMAKSDTAQAAAFGRLEATFSSTTSDAAEQGEDEHVEAGQAQQQQIAKPAQARTSQAPPPPAKRARGAGGTNQVSASTTDFAAFERHAMGGGT